MYSWNYVFQWAIVLPLELVIAGEVTRFWGVDIHVAVWITVFIVAITLINIFGVLGYGEEEFWTSLLKLSTVVIFIIIGLVLVLGGGPSGGMSSVPYYSSTNNLKECMTPTGEHEHGMIPEPSETASKDSVRRSSPRLSHSPEQNL